jgi:hypothetical protein
MDSNFELADTSLNASLTKNAFGTAVTLANNTPYTTTSDGYVSVDLGTTVNTSDSNAQIIVNDLRVFNILAASMNRITYSLFVRKGSVVKIIKNTNTPGDSIFNFIPLV